MCVCKQDKNDKRVHFSPAVVGYLVYVGCIVVGSGVLGDNVGVELGPCCVGENLEYRDLRMAKSSCFTSAYSSREAKLK